MFKVCIDSPYVWPYLLIEVVTQCLSLVITDRSTDPYTQNSLSRLKKLSIFM